MSSLDTDTPTDFPFLTTDEFSTACRHLISQAHWPDAFVTKLHEELVGKLNHVRSISITRLLTSGAIPEQSYDTSQVADEVEMEADDELVVPIRDSFARHPHVKYEIHLSPSYQVPVLYLSLRNLPPSRQSNIDFVHELLVPSEYKLHLKSVGVMGAITYADHPSTGMPTLFVHPCNTADALRELGGGHIITLEKYLMVWLGLIGGSVGLFPQSPQIISFPKN